MKRGAFGSVFRFANAWFLCFALFVAASASTAQQGSLHEAGRWFLMGRPAGDTSFERALSWAVMTGRESSLAISAVDSNHQYLAMSNGGVLVSQDGGRSWTNVAPLFSQIDARRVIADTKVAEVAYAAIDGMLYSSSNAGLNWQNMGVSSQFVNISADGATLFSVHEAGITVVDRNGTVITNYSVAWPDVENGLYGKVAVDARDANTAYVLVNGSLLLTRDGGLSWSSAMMLSNTGIIQMMADVSVGGLAYVLTDANGLYRTIDGGMSWVKLEGEKVDVNGRSIPIHGTDWHNYELASEDGKFATFSIDGQMVSGRIPSVTDSTFSDRGVYMLYQYAGGVSSCEVEFIKIK